jgi:hypothetical protein
MGTQILTLAIRVHSAGVPLFNRVVSLRQRNHPGVPVNRVQWVYRSIDVDWSALAVANGQVDQVAAETLGDRQQDDIMAHQVSGDGDSSAGLTSEDEPSRVD